MIQTQMFSRLSHTGLIQAQTFLRFTRGALRFSALQKPPALCMLFFFPRRIILPCSWQMRSLEKLSTPPTTAIHYFIPPWGTRSCQLGIFDGRICWIGRRKWSLCLGERQSTDQNDRCISYAYALARIHQTISPSEIHFQTRRSQKYPFIHSPKFPIYFGLLGALVFPFCGLFGIIFKRTWLPLPAHLTYQIQLWSPFAVRLPSRKLYLRKILDFLLLVLSNFCVFLDV